MVDRAEIGAEDERVRRVLGRRQQLLDGFDAGIRTDHRRETEFARRGHRLEVAPAEIRRSGPLAAHQGDVDQKELVTVGRGLHHAARADGIVAAHVDDGDRLGKRLGFLNGGGERPADLIGCSARIERNDQLNGFFRPLRMSETGAGQQPDGGNRDKSFHVIPLFFARSNVLFRRLLV